MRRSDPLLMIVAIAVAPLVVGIVAIFRQLPEIRHLHAIQLDHATDAVGVAFAVTTVALLLVGAVFRSMGVERLVRQGNLAALSVGAWAAFFLAFGEVDKHDVKGALVGGGAGIVLVVAGAAAATLWEAHQQR